MLLWASLECSTLEEMLGLVDVNKQRRVVLQHIAEAVGGVAGGDGVKGGVRQPVAVHRVPAVESQQPPSQASACPVDEGLALEGRRLSLIHI